MLKQHTYHVARDVELSEPYKFCCCVDCCSYFKTIRQVYTANLKAPFWLQRVISLFLIVGILLLLCRVHSTVKVFLTLIKTVGERQRLQESRGYGGMPPYLTNFRTRFEEKLPPQKAIVRSKKYFCINIVLYAQIQEQNSTMSSFFKWKYIVIEVMNLTAAMRVISS